MGSFFFLLKLELHFGGFFITFKDLETNIFGDSSLYTKSSSVRFNQEIVGIPKQNRKE